MKLNKNEIIEFVETLKNTYPDATCSLDFKTPFELVVAVMLSAQCTDERVNNALLVISFDTKTLKFEKCELDDFYKNLSNGTIKYSIDEEKASLCTVPVAVKKFAEENKEKLGIQNPVLKLECTLRGWM